MKLTIDYKHTMYGEGTVTTLPVDVMKWERMTKQKFSELYRQDADGTQQVHIGVGDLMTMVFAVLTRQGRVTESFDSFAANVEVVEFGDDVETDPTQAEPLAVDS